MAKTKAQTPLAQFLADHEGGNDWALALNTGHGLPVWRAYLRYRERGVPVHEKILEQFDRWGLALEAVYARVLQEELPEKAEHRLILQALCFAGTKERPKGFKLLAKHDRRRDLAFRLALLRNAGKGKLTWEEMAHAVGLNEQQAKDLFGEFNPGPRKKSKRAKEASAARAFDVLARKTK